MRRHTLSRLQGEAKACVWQIMTDAAAPTMDRPAADRVLFSRCHENIPQPS
jgi:hypothetical protein